MALRTHMAIALTLTAFGLAPGAAHLLELPVKLSYSPSLYADVTSTLYAWYCIAGGTIQVAAALSVAALALRLRQTPLAGTALAAAAALVVSLVLWGGLVAPANRAWAEVSAADPAAFVAAYEGLRARWEYGHVAAFLAWLSGWAGLVSVATRQITPVARRAA